MKEDVFEKEDKKGHKETYNNFVQGRAEKFVEIFFEELKKIQARLDALGSKQYNEAN